jgi:hypothetical protein
MKQSQFLALITRLFFVLALSACIPSSPLSVPVSPTSALELPTSPVAILAAAPTPTPLPSTPAAPASAGILPQYFSPLPNAEYVSTGATIIIRYGPELTAQHTTGLKFNVQGSQTGLHPGQNLLADDHKTVIFKPNQPFKAGEQVLVQVNRLQLDSQTSYGALTYTFKVAANQGPGGVGISTELPAKPPSSAYPNALTIPQDIPHFSITQNSADTGEGDIFVAPFYWTRSTIGSYLLILDQQGHLVYYKSVADAQNGFDFKKQPNGLLSYYDLKHNTYNLMDSHYQVVNTYQAGNGYTADLHDFQILPNGNALLMAYDNETVDMSRVVLGGKVNATVTGLIIQEMDPSKNVIFEWRSWDHVLFSDSTANLTGQNIDLVHGNSLSLMNDGNLLLSSRNLSELTKINLETGAVMWRLGGKANMFTFVNGLPFAFQHDARQLPNGNITVFDNQGNDPTAAPSRGVEYKLDEANKTVTTVWQFTHQPPVFGSFMGNVQRLANGNSFLNWGAASTAAGYKFVSLTELSPDNQVIFEFTFDQPYVSYRAFRFPWQGFPTTTPALAFKADANGLTLVYSWNGATEVAAYQIYAGSSPQSLNPLEKQARTDFETQSHLANLPQGECYFQVAPLDKDGQEMARSQVISTDPAACPLNR